MKLILLCFLFAVSSAFAIERIQLSFKKTDLRQGELAHGVLSVGAQSLNLPLQKLRGQTFAETLYFQQISPLVRLKDSEEYHSDVQVIFLKIPEGNQIQGKLDASDVQISWNPVTIAETQASQQLLWGDFSAPDLIRRNWIYLILIPVLLIAGYYGFRLWQKLERRKKLKADRKVLFDELIAGGSYEDVVNLWKKKHVFLREFPQIEARFQGLEEVLFKVQFKPTQSEAERSRVVSAYQKFLNECREDLRGV